MDIATIIGIFFGIGMIVSGNLIEGGKIQSFVGIPAGMIVFGGTAGAVLTQFRIKSLINMVAGIKSAFLGVKLDQLGLIHQIVDFARRARREGILALEKEIPNITDPFFSKALSMAVDGLEPKTLYETMETEMSTTEEEWKDKAEALEAAGGYSPTCGIIGAVLGLIVVMGNLEDIKKVGEGIASAFVATIYGLFLANLICLPLAGKIKSIGKDVVKTKEMTLKGVLLIQEGINHSIIEEELKGFLEESKRAKYTSAAGGE
jgi:chemotaxis protein MotA